MHVAYKRPRLQSVVQIIGENSTLNMRCDVTYLDSLPFSFRKASCFDMHCWNLWAICYSHAKFEDKKYDTVRIQAAMIILSWPPMMLTKMTLAILWSQLVQTI